MTWEEFLFFSITFTSSRLRSTSSMECCQFQEQTKRCGPLINITIAQDHTLHPLFCWTVFQYNKSNITAEVHVCHDTDLCVENGIPYPSTRWYTHKIVPGIQLQTIWWLWVYLTQNKIYADLRHTSHRDTYKAQAHHEIQCIFKTFMIRKSFSAWMGLSKTTCDVDVNFTFSFFLTTTDVSQYQVLWRHFRYKPNSALITFYQRP